MFCCIGAYTINSKPFDLFVMAFFAVFGYVALKLDCEPAPLMLGFVLGPMMEENLRRALLISRGDPMVFLHRADQPRLPGGGGAAAHRDRGAGDPEEARGSVEGISGKERHGRGPHMSYREVSEIRDGMRIDWDMPIKMDDGIVLRCDIYRPIKAGPISGDPDLRARTASGCTSRTSTAEQWRRMCENHPDVPTGSTNKYQCWEVVDPEKWVPDGYVCIRVDSRGAGRSPGVIDIWSLREAQDLAQCVEWAGVQPWSNGKVGLNGISYYAENQWQCAALQPKHLAAICLWEGAADFYRDMAHHGGIFCNGFTHDWSRSQVYTLQHGRGTRGFKSRMNGDWVSGPIELTEEELGANRRNFYEDCLARKLDTDEYWQSRMPDWSKVKVPLFSAANWGGQGLHPRGNFEGFVRAASKQKWLEVPRPRALDAFLHRLRRRPAEEVLRPFPQGRGDRLEQAAEGAAAGPPRRQVRRAAREGMAAQAHASGPSSSSTRPTSRCRPSGRRRKRR